MSRRSLMSLVLFALAAGGCHDMFPDVYRPGPEGYQRLRAQRMDPFPEPDIGPEVVGGRPRDFDKPPAEATRAGNPPPQWRKSYHP